MEATIKPIAVLEAPSNLGLRPPEPGSVPGVYKLPGALRDCGIVERIGGQLAGVVVPPRYRVEWDGRSVRNGAAIAAYSVALAARVGGILDGGAFPVVLGGDCSILLGNMLALRRSGQYGLVFIDGHLDFRHLGNSDSVGAAAGEDLALITGRGENILVNIDGLRPYVREANVVALGARDDDEYAEEARAAGIDVSLTSEVRGRGLTESATEAVRRLSLAGVDGFWVHLDLDVLDSALLPAVDSREPNGLDFDELGELLVPLLRSAAGLEVTIFDPDLDPTGEQAERVTDMLSAAISRARS